MHLPVFKINILLNVILVAFRNFNTSRLDIKIKIVIQIRIGISYIYKKA